MDGPGIHLISPWAHVASDSRGLVLVAGGRFPEIAVFDSLGTFLQVVGGKGDGPGEYRGISHIDAGPRYLQVFEYNGRRTLLDSSYAPLRVDQLPGVVLSSWITTADTAILAADFRSPGSVGDPLHLLSLDGTLSSYGSDSRVVKGPSPTLVVGGIGDQVWSLNQGTN
ncbi:MAG TPA: hypothetical protein VKA53_05335, partial [Thermoanaerobaculia bacterium]|nr:hypothetical protein [Thermoanaerobaculia bacterium]